MSCLFDGVEIVDSNVVVAISGYCQYSASRHMTQGIVLG